MFLKVLTNQKKKLVLTSIILLSVFTFIAYFNNDDPEPFIDYTAGVHYKLPNHLIGKALPFHQIYESRVIGFHQYKHAKNRHFQGNKILLFWTPWNSQYKTINYYFLQPGNVSFSYEGCANKKCIATHDRNALLKADAVLFHLIDLNLKDLPRYRHPRQLWILYCMEAPWLILKDLPNPNLLDGLFNLTMSYRVDSDIVVRYGFIGPSSEVELQPNYEELFKNKTGSVVWFTSDCNTDSRREKYVKILKQYINVDIYGSCGEFRCFPSQSDICYENVLSKYKFYLSFENALCKDYVTEKFFNVFNYDIIPVVFGGANYSSFVPPDTYIDTRNYVNPKDLADELHRIGSNEKLFSQILRNKLKWRAFLDPWTCKLCDTLHDIEGHGSATITDVRKWFIEEATCYRWNGETKSAPYWQSHTLRGSHSS